MMTEVNAKIEANMMDTADESLETLALHGLLWLTWYTPARI